MAQKSSNDWKLFYKDRLCDSVGKNIARWMLQERGWTCW